MARSFLLEKLKLDDGNGQRLVTASHLIRTVRGNAFKRFGW
jgi:hypothetical protein